MRRKIFKQLYQIGFLILVLLFAFFPNYFRPPQVKGASTVPHQTQKPIIAYSSRLVCSLLGQNQKNVGIYGQDGGASTAVSGKSYFMFGDITGSSGQWILPNSVSYTTDSSAANCLNLTSKSAGGAAQPLFSQLASVGEATAWP